MNNNDNNNTTILVIPFPAQGHLNQFLHLSLRLATSGHFSSVHFAGSSIHILQIISRFQGWPSSSLFTLHIHHFPLPPFSTPPPNPSSIFSDHLLPLFHSLYHLQPSLSSLLHSLSSSSKRLIVIHDPLMSFAAKQALSLETSTHIQVFKFICSPCFYHLSFLPNKTSSDLVLKQFPGCLSDTFLEFRNSGHDDKDAVEDGFIINSCEAIEGAIIEDFRRAKAGKRVFAVGPVHPLVDLGRARRSEGLFAPSFPSLILLVHTQIWVCTKSGSDPHALGITPSIQTLPECLDWLDKQVDKNVLYVAFGTTSMMSDEQIEELAIGLEKSEQKFIWVLRDADGGDVTADEQNADKRRRKLPQGYEERLKGVGIVVRDWVPQLEILAHKAIGAFMSHCGWNSCMESLSFGVPILAWPMHSGQPRNATCLSEYLKVGFMVRDWEHRMEVVSSMVIVEVVKRLMVSDEGMEVKKRARELGEQIRVGVSHGGSSWKEMQSFISYIST
ncbi:zeatin O-xylosyltransferase-like [Dioscorea cayenensis subsp. rotundata]|uniref:Zeatin O-xylosyltransferase-like n=1 Tax=Dioscorea cayennensis subsp. rotundata TaxID=55577 RepID=A0AB40CEB9_DIOCR|nr:zeatin O-xylosyltransferase-like [Dioscorea cayenensis subsp. rotundata]